MRPEKDLANRDAGARFVDLVALEGSAAEPLVIDGIRDLRSLCPRFVSDVAHYLCVLHGRFPGIVDHAAHHVADPEARDWMLQATEAFATERNFLTRLTVASGPVLSSATDENCAQAFAAQAHALEMLGTSDRRGCAAGAAVAFIEDWLAIRRLLDTVAMKVGIAMPQNLFPDSSDNAKLVSTLSSVSPNVERALFFGADQLLTQQRAFWKMMSARAEARSNG